MEWIERLNCAVEYMEAHLLSNMVMIHRLHLIVHFRVYMVLHRQ